MLTYEAQLDRDFNWALLEGSRYFECRSAVHETMRRLTERLDELTIDYAIAGDLCIFFHGNRRFTEIVDVLVTREGLAKIHEALEGRGYVKPFAASKNLRDARTGVKIDFIISGQYPGDGKPGPIAFPVPRDASVELDGIRVLSLEKWIELKLASGKLASRLRDLADVQDVIQTLKLPRDLADRLDPSLRDSFFQRWDDAQKAASEEY